MQESQVAVPQGKEQAKDPPEPTAKSNSKQLFFSAKNGFLVRKNRSV